MIIITQLNILLKALITPKGTNMADIIELHPEETGTGYLLNENNEIEGVYAGSIAAMVDYDNVYLGAKADDGIDEAVLTSIEDLNEFCLMWLLIYDPEVIKEDVN